MRNNKTVILMETIDVLSAQTIGFTKQPRQCNASSSLRSAATTISALRWMEGALNQTGKSD
jgi:hypothetical protein